MLKRSLPSGIIVAAMLLSLWSGAIHAQTNRSAAGSAGAESVADFVLPVDAFAADTTGPAIEHPVTEPAIVYHKVKFDANGGKIGKKKAKAIQVEAGKKVGKLPNAKWKGNKFQGWYTKKKGGKKVSANTKITKGLTLYARWLRMRLDVPLHPQFPQFPSGCEAASVSMMLSYATGKNITVADVVSRTRYRGNPRGWSAYTMPGDMVPVVKHYAGTAKILSGAKWKTIQKYINKNRPVVVWIQHPSVGFHCVCITGYSKGYVYYNDPWRGQAGGKDKKVKSATFQRWWSSLNKWAISY